MTALRYTPDSVRVLLVDAAVTLPLRLAVLRPGQASGPMFDREADPRTVHVAALCGGRVLSVGCAMPDGHPQDPRPGDWRLRGMATCAELRGSGVGALVLAQCEASVRAAGGLRLWCNARTPARSFYERGDLAVEGEQFEIAGVGPHLLMSKPLL